MYEYVYVHAYTYICESILSSHPIFFSGSWPWSPEVNESSRLWGWWVRGTGQGRDRVLLVSGSSLKDGWRAGGWLETG